MEAERRGIEHFPQSQSERESDERRPHREVTREGFVVAAAERQDKRARERHERQDGDDREMAHDECHPQIKSKARTAKAIPIMRK